MRPGVWEVSAAAGYREDGRPRRVYRTVKGTATDADRALRALMVEMDEAPSLGMRSTIADYWPVFERRLRQKGVTNATLTDYEKEWRLRIEPAFGHLRWSDLRFRDVQSWVLTLPRSSAQHAVRTLRRMMNCAVDDELVERSIFTQRRIDYPIERPDPYARGRTGWGAAHVAEAMRRLEGHRIEPLFLALVGGGLRVEEGLALWWEDLEAMDAVGGGGRRTMLHASITKAWTEADGLHGTKNEFSRRLVPIPDPFASRLMELRVEGERVPLWPLYPGRSRKEWRSLFDEGGPLDGMPRAQMKDMRSVHETIMQDAGALDTVNARLHGRSNISTGYRHYLKPSGALDDAARLMGEKVRVAR